MKRFFILISLLFISLNTFGKPLSAESIFVLNAKVQDPNTILLTWDIKPGHFLYKERTKIVTIQNHTFEIGTIPFPTAILKTNKLGKTETIYRESLSLPVPILGKDSGEGILTIRYQGCSEEGFCYPPQLKKIKVAIAPNLSLLSVEIEGKEPVMQAQDKVTHLLKNHNLPWIIIGFLGFGLLLSFTPCVLPMVPVLSGIIVGAQVNTKKAFLLSLTYVLSMSATYGVVGASVALMGQNLQVVMQKPVFILALSTIFIMLSCSMFGLYELQMPRSLQNRLGTLSRKQQNGGQFLGSAIMGCLATLILSPCVTAPLIGALSYIAQTGDIMLGVGALFFLGLGMGIPLIIIGTSAGKWLPKAGPWMNVVKTLFGFLLLGVAAYLLSKLISSFWTIMLFALLAIAIGIYFFFIRGRRLKVLTNGLGALALGYGCMLLLGVILGNATLLQPFSYDKTKQNSFPVATNLAQIQTLIQKSSGKPIILDFYAEWCASCKIMAKTTLKDPKIVKALNDFAVITVDLTANDKDSEAILSHYQIVAPPTFVFINSSGGEIAQARMVGEVSPESFFASLKKILSYYP